MKEAIRPDTGPKQFTYTQLQKKVCTFRFVEYSEGSAPEIN